MKVSLLAVLALLPWLLPAGAPAARAQAGRSPLTELTQLARRFPRHRGPTTLYVNFDGWRNFDRKGHHVRPFQSSGDRDRDIQLILFRTAEIYAPFDVQVCRLRGTGKHDRGRRGNTTVFVGAHTNHVNRRGEKHPRGYTSRRSTDHPGRQKGVRHRPNSDPYDLAFVDPVGQQDGGWANVWSVDRISRSIAHEAGHTFGLAHTLTAPVHDIMSYDAKIVFFANRTFPITDLNNNARTGVVHTGERMVPRWGRRRITRQNAYTYLLAVLGARPADDHARVANEGSVDPSFHDGPLTELAPGTPQSGAVERRGDYDVFLLRPDGSGRRTVRVLPAPGSELAPVLFVFDAAGRQLLGFANGKGRADRAAQDIVEVIAGKPCKVVVGGADACSTGAYRVSVGPQP